MGYVLFGRRTQISGMMDHKSFGTFLLLLRTGLKKRNGKLSKETGVRGQSSNPNSIKDWFH